MRRALAAAALLAGALAARPAGAYPLRAPQVLFNFGPLQAFLGSIDPAVSLFSDQLNVPSWSDSAFGRNDFTIVLIHPGSIAIGMYPTDSATPAVAPLFDAGAVRFTNAVLHFGAGGLVIYHFDENSTLLGWETYPDIHRDHFQFTSQGPCGAWFGDDARNAPPGPQVLAYRSSEDFGAFPDFYLCFEACAYQPASTFDAAVIQLESSRGDAASRPSWGAVKAHYR